MYLGQNTLTTFTQAGGDTMAIESGAMQAVPYGDVEAVPVGPDCPPPTVIYRDRIITKIVEKQVPGPTQIIYRDRYVTQPGEAPSMAMPDDQASELVYPVDRIPAASGDDAAPEDSEMSEGSIEPKLRIFGDRVPWWMLAAAVAGAAWYFTQKP